MCLEDMAVSSSFADILEPRVMLSASLYSS
ncbi:MAG: LEPR-XLL domain-containing protein [Ruminococcaceae bacterium]|nr:LEPR-XLL domain-containing protein [Oscillospiraceae bacterium]